MPWGDLSDLPGPCKTSGGEEARARDLPLSGDFQRVIASHWPGRNYASGLPCVALLPDLFSELVNREGNRSAIEHREAAREEPLTPLMRSVGL